MPLAAENATYPRNRFAIHITSDNTTLNNRHVANGK